MVRILYNLSELRDSMFGQPPPRHGLRLLWWFANECIQIDSAGFLIAMCDPVKGDFGFSPYYNGDRRLPFITKFPFHKVGNLNKRGCQPKQLPEYVTENYKGTSADRNTDRIIVSLSSLWNSQERFEGIYVTQHSDQANFDQNHTYQISQDLIKDIKNLTLAEFLRQMKNDPNLIHYNQHVYRNVSSSTPSIQAFHNPRYAQQMSYSSEDCNMSEGDPLFLIPPEPDEVYDVIYEILVTSLIKFNNAE
ncbi:hypothetical protein E1301_Tti012132 [Triplophysa tibetana]|uniref:Uncharacterized protein n=1 Tax=Triplophysa tibetana TaxID=1572043 RepID=A0A5A9PJS9_9TELE|nr:hypothetical protein E1301_Tti012132 [Triplophysa tibetana]